MLLQVTVALSHPFPDATTHGLTIEEVRENLKEAITAYLEVFYEHEKEIPSDYSFEFFQPITFKKKEGKLIAYA